VGCHVPVGPFLKTLTKAENGPIYYLPLIWFRVPAGALMCWIRKSPFRPGEDVASRMVSLLSEEAAGSGTPLTEAEKEILRSEVASPSEELRQKSLKLIGQILERERGMAMEENSKGFGACLEWVEPDYPNIAAFAEEVIMNGGVGGLPPLHGRRWFKDRAQLIGSGFLIVLFMLLIGAVWGLISSRK